MSTQKPQETLNLLVTEEHSSTYHYTRFTQFAECTDTDCKENYFRGRIYSECSENIRKLLTIFSEMLNKQTPWPESASELYRPSDRRLSAKLVPTFADRGVSRSQRGGCLRP
jgi:hypothetical protein